MTFTITCAERRAPLLEVLDILVCVVVFLAGPSRLELVATRSALAVLDGLRTQRRRRGVGLEPERIDVRDRVLPVAVFIQIGPDAERVGAYIAARFGVIIAMPVVM